jgi:hypothetical protein
MQRLFMSTSNVHEYLEATMQRLSHLQAPAAAQWLHNEAITHAPDTLMPITPGAKHDKYSAHRWRSGLVKFLFL